MQEYQKILTILREEYPELMLKWYNYCKWNEWDIGTVDIILLRLWLEKRHEDFLFLFERKT